MSDKDKRETITILGALVALYILSVAIGFIFCLVGYTSTDTCWLLKLGKIILKEHALPKGDPFSFTVPLQATAGIVQPFVIYQWLSEILFAWSFQAGNLIGPLLLCTLVTVTAAINVLLRVCLRASNGFLISVLLVGLSVGCVALRLMVRPEIFSLLLLAIWILILQHIRSWNREQSLPPSPSSFWIVAAAALTMLVWCNIHSGFVIGIVSLAAYAAVLLLQDLLQRKLVSERSKIAIFSLVASVAVSLINPRGIHLWIYLPHLFFSPFNSTARETQSIGIREFTLLPYYPYFILLGVAAFACTRTVQETLAKLQANSKATTLSVLWKLIAEGQFLSIVMIAISTIATMCCKRLVAPLSFFLAAEAAMLIGSLPQASRSVGNFLKGNWTLLLKVDLPVVLFAMLTVAISNDRVAPLTLPQASAFFQPSFPAIEYLFDHWRQGRIFNNIQIGSMLCMYGRPELKVFIDTRLDVYGNIIPANYWTIIQAREGYENLLDSYQVDWVIITPEDELASALQQNKLWRKEFEDEAAVIFARQQPYTARDFAPEPKAMI